MTALPLFDRYELEALRHEREELLKRLRKGGMDRYSRIRMQRKVTLITAELMKLELQIGRK
jgi:hypothetical protein